MHVCVDSRDQSRRAAKIFPYTSGLKHEALAEYENMRRLRHDRIVHLHEAFLTSNNMVLVLEKIEGGELLKYLCWREDYTEELVAQIVRQVSLLRKNTECAKQIE